MTTDPLKNALGWDGVGPLGPVWEELARRMSASERPVRRIAVTGLDDRGRRTLASLLGLLRVPDQAVVRVDVTRIGAALGLADDSQLRQLVERVQGPIGNRAALRAAASGARTTLWSLAQERMGSRVPNTLARIQAAGVPNGDVEAHARTLQALADSLDCLPAAPPMPLPMLAWRISGDPHALDSNTTCGRYLQLAAVELAGNSRAEPDGIAARRALQALGVIVDRLSVATITFGLRAQPDSTLGRVLEAGIATNAPVNVSGALLDGMLPRFFEGSWLCVENPSIVEVALLTGCAGPLVCTSGWPSMDAQRLLDIARAQGIEILYAGDYDFIGLAIASFMFKRYGARIVMNGNAYLQADLARAPNWGAESVPPTPWAPELADAIRDKQRIVYQEDPAIWQELVKHLRPDDVNLAPRLEHGPQGGP